MSNNNNTTTSSVFVQLEEIKTWLAQLRGILERVLELVGEDLDDEEYEPDSTDDEEPTAKKTRSAQ